MLTSIYLGAASETATLDVAAVAAAWARAHALGRLTRASSAATAARNGVQGARDEALFALAQAMSLQSLLAVMAQADSRYLRAAAEVSAAMAAVTRVLGTTAATAKALR